MAQKNHSRNSEGVCKKIYNAVCPLRATIRRISHQPRGSLSIANDKKPLSKNPVRISSLQHKPVHVSHQPSLSKTIPIAYELSAAQENNTLATLSPVVHSSREENISGKPEQGFVDREIPIVNGQRFAKSASRKRALAQPEKAPLVSTHRQAERVAPTEYKPTDRGSFAKAKSKKDDDSMHEANFSDYIDKVKNRMMRTTSNVGGSGSGRTSPRRDIFNDKVTNYINQAKAKMRKTTTVGDHENSGLLKTRM